MSAVDTVRAFFGACRAGDYEQAGRHVQLTERTRITDDLTGRIVSVLRILAQSDEFAVEEFSVGEDVQVELPEYKIIQQDAMIDIPYQVAFETPTGPTEVVGFARTVCESSPFAADVDGVWGVSTISLLRQRRRSRTER